MAKLHRVEQKHPNHPEYLFECPGCGIGHWFKTTGDQPRWNFNGDMDRPTIRPSLLVRSRIKCHSFVTDGRIQFLSDCDHELAGQTVDLPDI